ncbi:hypothetical protein [Ralstonia syzygii]|uniref:hypothetical protein n=1 Tax=Ralstonia syzygii TaxID=28097 RepID=UPI0018D1D774|nr:hypothetical protein [Ralstonia syzygii]
MKAYSHIEASRSVGVAESVLRRWVRRQQEAALDKLELSARDRPPIARLQAAKTPASLTERASWMSGTPARD